MIKQRKNVSVIIMFRNEFVQVSKSLSTPAYIPYQHQGEEKSRFQIIPIFMERSLKIYCNFTEKNRSEQLR